MSNKIILKKSSVADKIPQNTDLAYGELALNYADGKLYFKNSSNEIDAFNVNIDLLTSGTGLSYNTSTGTISLDSDTAATANTIALRDGSGNLTANNLYNKDEIDAMIVSMQNIDGGFAGSVYLATQNINGGGAEWLT